MIDASKSAAEAVATEERIDPRFSPAEFLQEHAARYVLAARYCAGKTVLDVASGIGYGTDYLQKRGAQAVGLEIDESAIAFARTKYTGPTYSQGSADRMSPGWSESYDVVVSFETIEHLSDPGVFLGEVTRCLRPGGLFLCSTPNRSLYLFQGRNRFHTKEFYFGEFLSFVGSRLRVVEVLGQSFRPYWSVATSAAHALASQTLRFLGIPPLGISEIFSRRDIQSPFEDGFIVEDKVLARYIPATIPAGAVPTFVTVLAQKSQ